MQTELWQIMLKNRLYAYMKLAKYCLQQIHRLAHQRDQLVCYFQDWFDVWKPASKQC